MSSTTNHPFLFTVIAEIEGSTIVEQVVAMDVKEAYLAWAKITSIGLAPVFNADDTPSPLDGLASVFCISGIDSKERFFLAHFVSTRR